jgi:hypothetical protein
MKSKTNWAIVKKIYKKITIFLLKSSYPVLDPDGTQIRYHYSGSGNGLSKKVPDPVVSLIYSPPSL